MSSVVVSHVFDPSTIAFGSLEKTKKGGKIVYINASETEKSKVSIQTPAMIMPFGVTPYTESSGEIQSYSIDVSFRGDDPKIADFESKVRRLDDILIDTATARSEEWFGKKMTRDLVAEFYRKLLNDKNPAYPPVLKVKVGMGFNGEPNAQFYDETRAPVGIEYFGKGAVVKMIIELSSVWFVNKTFGATFRLVQAAVVTKPKRLDGYAFQEDAE
jgi:hypothetical protein